MREQWTLTEYLRKLVKWTWFVCLINMSKQTPVVAAILFVVSIILHTLSIFHLWDVSPTEWKRVLSLKVHLKALSHIRHIEGLHTVYFHCRICCVSLRHINTCYYNTDVLAMSADPFVFKVLRHETNLSSPQGGICCFFSWFLSFCRPVRFVTERLTRGLDHWQ